MGEQMIAAVTDIGFLLLLGAWLALNLSLMRDWIAWRRQERQVIR